MARVCREGICTQSYADDSGKHVVFGEVVSGMDVVKAAEKVGSKDGKVSSDKRVVVIKCGTV